MAGHREDGTYADDKAHHPNRKVSREAFFSAQMAAMRNDIPDLYDPGDMGEYNYDARMANATVVDESDYGFGNEEGSCSCGGSCSDCKGKKPF